MIMYLLSPILLVFYFILGHPKKKKKKSFFINKHNINNFLKPFFFVDSFVSMENGNLNLDIFV